MKKFWIVVIIIVVFIGGIFVWWQNGLQASNPNDTKSRIFVIEKGAGPREVGNDLKEQGFIKDPVVFFLYLKKEGIDTEIQAGSHMLSSSMTLPQVLEALQHGTVDVWVTIPEGYRAEQVAEVLAENVETYDESWILALQSEEGFLFPDTYLIPKDAEVGTIINIMKNNFRAKVEEAGIDPDRNDIKDIVTMASLIEREAITDEEKPDIAGVLHNRLNLGMALQVDATIQYAKGQSGSWWDPVTIEEYNSVNSRYNTYLEPGLPPAPIANPGIEAIKAAVNPTESSYLYYIHDANGQVYFAETLDEHNSNIDKYLN